jgi:SAM-dependent methyltransferase
MRDNVRTFIEIAAATFEPGGPVYEFGSYQVAGQEQLSDLRRCFPGRRYIGCDLRPGPGVDQVEDLSRLSLPDGSARTIICVDTLEHVFEARRAADEMIRVLAPGGLLLLAAPMDFRVHDYPSDYWRLTPSCVARLLSPLAASIVAWQGVENHPHTVFGIGCKTPVAGAFSRRANRFMEALRGSLAALRERQDWRVRLKDGLTQWTRGKGERRRRAEQHKVNFALHLPIQGRHELRELASVPSGASSRGRLSA